MATRKITKTNRDTVLSAVTSNAFKLEAATNETLRAIRDAGEASKDTRKAFIVGFVAGTLARISRTKMDEAAAIAAATKAIDAPGMSSTKPDRRTKEQETAYAAARKAWSRITAKAKVKPVDARGGARAPKASTANVDKPTEAAAPTPVKTATKVRTAVEAGSIFGDIAALVRNIRDGSAKALTTAERDFAATVLSAFEAYTKAKAETEAPKAETPKAKGKAKA